jgi:BRCT domain type II-containing protein
LGIGDSNQSATAAIVPTVIGGKHPAFPSFSPDGRRPVMSTFREKAQARTKQMVGQMIGDEQLVEEGKDQERKAEQPAKPSAESSPAKSSQAKSSQAKSSQARSSDDPSGRTSRH